LAGFEPAEARSLAPQPVRATSTDVIKRSVQVKANLVPAYARTTVEYGLLMQHSESAGLRLQPVPCKNACTRFKPFSFPFIVPEGSNGFKTVCTRFKRFGESK
jgi:hypothetical protein